MSSRDITTMNARCGSRVMYKKTYPGTVRYVGPIIHRNGEWIGLELDEPAGKHDGTIQGRNYFSCRVLHGIFVRPSELQFIVSRPGGGYFVASGSKTSRSRPSTPSRNSYVDDVVLHGRGSSSMSLIRSANHFAPRTPTKEMQDGTEKSSVASRPRPKSASSVRKPRTGMGTFVDESLFGTPSSGHFAQFTEEVFAPSAADNARMKERILRKGGGGVRKKPHVTGAGEVKTFVDESLFGNKKDIEKSFSNELFAPSSEELAAASRKRDILRSRSQSIKAHERGRSPELERGWSPARVNSISVQDKRGQGAAHVKRRSKSADPRPPQSGGRQLYSGPNYATTQWAIRQEDKGPVARPRTSEPSALPMGNSRRSIGAVGVSYATGVNRDLRPSIKSPALAPRPSRLVRSRPSTPNRSSPIKAQIQYNASDYQTPTRPPRNATPRAPRTEPPPVRPVTSDPYNVYVRESPLKPSAVPQLNLSRVRNEFTKQWVVSR